MINKFLTDIKIIKNAAATKKLVIFAGAGISVDAGVPSWIVLVDEIKKELDLPAMETDFLKIPQIYYNERQEKEYVEKIRTILSHKKLKYNEIHEEIFELSPEHIITTNFEDLLEQVISKKSLPFSIIKNDMDLPYSENTKLLVKMHGDLETANFVLKEDDYINYSKNHPLIEAFVHSIFATKVVLFIGYSFNDYNLKLIVQNVRNILGNNFQNAYLISTDEKIHHSHKQYLKNKGINVLDYFDAEIVSDNGGKENYIEEFLKGKNIYRENYNIKPDNLTTKGILLLNFLKFIRHYDKLKILLLPTNVIDQMSESLDRFSEIKSLPQHFISKLYPFKTSSEPEYLIQGTTLLLKNEVLKKLFLEKFKIENNLVKYNNDEDLPATLILNYEEKLRKIVIKLNNSLIYYVTPENEKADSFGSKGFPSQTIDINLKREIICECSKCKYQKFEFAKTLKEINNYSINEISDLQEDIQKAYLNYKLGNFFQAFNMFEEIASKAWQTGKYITYYIAKTNMKSMKWTVKSDEDIMERDKNRFEDIDTDKLIFQIPYKSNEEYELLKIIRDDSILIKCRNEIDKLYIQIKVIYEGYKGEYYSYSGSDYAHKVSIEMHKLSHFYTENYIVGDIFSNFKNVLAKGVEALIISHITSDNYGEKLRSLSSTIFYFAISYCNATTLRKFLKKYDVVELKFDEDAVIEIINYCLNYFNSFFIESKFAFNNSYKNDLVFNQLSKDFFKNEMSSHFSKILLLSTYIEFPDSKKREYIESLLTFLRYEDFLYGDEISFLKTFLKKNSELFSENDVKNLIEIIHSKTGRYDMYNIIETIANIAKANGYELLKDKAYTLKVLSNIDYTDRYKNSIVWLWIMANTEIKEELHSILLEKLNTHFDSDLYVEACYNNMLDYNLFFENYLIEVKKIDDKMNYVIFENKYKLLNFHIHNAIIFIYFTGVKSTDNRLQTFNTSSDQIQFFIFRDKFDLTKVKIEWLYLINSGIIYNELSKITKLKKIIVVALKSKYEERLSRIYTKFFL